MLAPWKKSYAKPRQCIEKQRHHFAHKCPYSLSCGFPSSYVQTWELNHKEGWVLKNWCFQTVVLEKTLESPIHGLQGDQPWIFTGRVDAEVPICWPLDTKSWLTGKDPDAGKYGGQEKGAVESEMVGWHHHHSMDINLSKLQETVHYQLNGHEFE